MRVLLWHVHGSWTTAFVQGAHEYVLPVTPDRGPDGRGRARTWEWPSSVREVAPAELASLDLDAVLLQRPHELDLVARWTGRRPGVELPAVYLEHNTPGGNVPFTRHPVADQKIPVVHVTHFNRQFWDCGRTPTEVIEHGVMDPGHRYVGDLPRAAVAVNEPVRRGRAVGTDLLAPMSGVVPLDVFGMGVAGLGRHLGLAPERLTPYDDLPQDRLHQELPRRRVYLHLHRWTSLGLSLIEAMMLGLPVVALATTEATVAVPPGGGLLHTDPDRLAVGVRELLQEPDRARLMGTVAREHAVARYGVERFLDEWDRVLGEIVTSSAVMAASSGHAS